MIDREKVLTVLRRRFPGASPNTVAAAANAIVGLSDEWHEVMGLGEEIDAHLSRSCGERCGLAPLVEGEVELRVFKRWR